MPSIDDLAPGRYLKKGQLERPRLATVKTIRTENVAPDNRQPSLKPVIYFQEFEEGVPAGAQTRDSLKEALGTKEVSEMIGRKVVIFVNPDIVYGGQRVGGIRFRAPKQRPPAQGIPAATPPPAAPPQGWSNAVAPAEAYAGRRQDPSWATGLLPDDLSAEHDYADDVTYLEEP